MDLQLKKYQYNHTWFEVSEIKRLLPSFVDSTAPIAILEIGTFEGLSSCCFSDNLLNHPDSTMDCVDPFDLQDKNTPVTNQTETLFKSNISRSANANKCRFHRLFSDDFFKTNTLKFDLIYIDGSHALENIRADMLNSFRCLKLNGIMWMDDYLGGDGVAIRDCMNQVLSEFRDSAVIIHSGYQLAIRKLKE